MYASAVVRIGIVSRLRWLLPLAAFFVLAFGLLLWAEEADAWLGRDARFDGVRAVGLSEPALAADQEEISPCAVQPAYPAGSLGGLFSRPGMIGGFAAGFLGAGIFGLLFGHGVIGELSSVPSILGLIFQFALLLALGWLIRAWWSAGKATAVAQLSPRQLADAYGRDRDAGLPNVGSSRDIGSKDEREGIFASEEHSRL